MYILQVVFDDEGIELMRELARRGNYASPEDFMRKAMGLLGAGIQIEEMGGNLTCHFPNGATQDIECISDNGSTNLDGTALKPPKISAGGKRNANDPLAELIKKLGWAGLGLKILRDENRK